MDMTFRSIDEPSRTLVVRVESQFVGSGAQGSVYRATVNGEEGHCVKILTGVSAGSVRDEVATFKHLRAMTSARLKNPKVLGELRKGVESLYRYLPQGVAYEKLPGYEKEALLFSRPFCPGTSLHELLVDPPARNSEPYWRLSVAKKICRLMVALDRFGFVHLDPYPDNVLIENAENLNLIRISLIDLEGIGVLASDEDTAAGHRRWRDEFERAPKAFLKHDFWPLPWWYPTPAKTRARSDWFIYGALWQMLSLVTLTLTWGSTPGCWLDVKAFHELQSLAEQVRKEGRSPSNQELDHMESLLQQVDAVVRAEFVARCGVQALGEKLIDWFNSGFRGPRGSHWYWFRANELQDVLNEARVCRGNA